MAWSASNSLLLHRNIHAVLRRNITLRALHLTLLCAAALSACGADVDDGELASVESALVTAVPDLDGLGGTYLRVGFVPLGQLSRLVLTPGATANAGQYQRTLNRFCFPAPACARDAGSYDAIPENPAIGHAALVLGTGTARNIYRIDGIARDAQRRIQTLQLRPLTGNQWGAAFLVRRL